VLRAGVVRVLVVDDHPVVRDGVITALGRHSDIEVVGHAAGAVDAETACARERPDIVLLDLRLPDGLAAEHAVSPSSRVLLFTAFPEHSAVAPSLAAGAVGLLVKDASGTVLGDAIREVARTGSYRGRARVPADAPLTPREYDVLRLVATGHTNGEVGHDLRLSPNTVKTYLHNVMRKLDARNRAQVITNARARGLL
jgi:DNA-binding NarL/FixJ family response regulator